jgi:hypothetical protein
MRRILRPLVLFAILCPPGLVGQRELVVGAGIGTFAAGDFDGKRAGPALAAALHFTDPGPLQGGLELVYSRHGGMGVESRSTQFEVVALGRYSLFGDPDLGMLVGLKVGAGRRWLTVVDEPAEADLLVLGPSVATRFSVSGLRVQLTFDALYETFEEWVLYGSRAYGTDEDGLRLAVRAGLVFPLD